MCKKYFYLLFSVFFFLSILSPVFAAGREWLNLSKKDLLEEKETNYVPNELIVQYKDVSYTRDFKFQTNELASIGFEVKTLAKNGNYALVKIPKDSSLKDAQKELNQISEIEFAQPNYLYNKK